MKKMMFRGIYTEMKNLWSEMSLKNVEGEINNFKCMRN